MTTLDGRRMLAIGLSFGNLDRFRSHPGDTYIRIDGEPMELPFDIVIFSGETEAAMADMMSEFMDENTKVHIDPRLKT